MGANAGLPNSVIPEPNSCALRTHQRLSDESGRRYTERMDAKELILAGREIGGWIAVAGRHRPPVGPPPQPGFRRRYNPASHRHARQRPPPSLRLPRSRLRPRQIDPRADRNPLRNARPRRKHPRHPHRRHQSRRTGSRLPSSRLQRTGAHFRISSSHSALPTPHSTLPFVAVITAGTSDLPVAEEARETLDWMGVRGDDDPRRRRGRSASPAGPAGRVRRCRRDRRRRRHGRRPAEHGRRLRRLPGVRRARRASATAPTSAASPPCSRCSTAAPATSPS